MARRAILLANLGSPDKPETADVRRYLNQFLMDRHVIQLPWILRRMIVSLFVLPTRPKASAEAYRSIWWPEGSPLIVLSEQLQTALQKQLDMPVSLAMRYGNPSIEHALTEIARDPDIEEVVYMPLYPHFADSTITTSVEAAREVIDRHQLKFSLKVLQPFYDNPDYIQALVEQTRPYLQTDYDHLVFSYHGLPESHLTKRDPGQHCLQRADCCQVANPAHATCYRHQVMETTRAFVNAAGVPSDKYSVAFQSRLGRQKWLDPNTEDTLIELAKAGKKNVLVMCPAFVTDCLETLEEIAMQGEEAFKQAGGEKLTLVPCLNTHPAWVQVLADWAQQDYR